MDMGEIGFFNCCFSCLTSISISLLCRISDRDVGTEPVKFVDLIIELFGSEKVVVSRELFADEFDAKKTNIYIYHLVVKFIYN